MRSSASSSGRVLGVPQPAPSPRFTPPAAVQRRLQPRTRPPDAHAPPLQPAAATPLLLHTAAPLSSSIEQFQQLVAAEDEDDDDGEEEEGDEDEDDEPDAEPEEEEEEEQARGPDDDDDDEEDDMAAELLQLQGGVDPSLYPSAFAMGLGGMQMGHMAMMADDDFFPVHRADADDGEEDQMLTADSRANTPVGARSRRHSRAGSRRNSATMQPPPMPFMQHWPPVQPQPLPQAAAASPTSSRPSSPRLASIRRHSQMPPQSDLRASQSASRPLSADIERRSSADRKRHSPTATHAAGSNIPVAAQAAPAFASPPQSRRAPFHSFGQGPVAPRGAAAAAHLLAAGSPLSQPTSPPALLPPVPGLRSPPGRGMGPLPALQHSPSVASQPTLGSRPSSPLGGGASPRFVAPDASFQQQQHQQQLVQSKNSFQRHQVPAASSSAAPPPPRAAVTAAPHPHPLFPDFPSSHPTPLPGPFSAASSQPVTLAVVALPPSAGSGAQAQPCLFELPAGYEIVRKLPVGGGAFAQSPHTSRGMQSPPQDAAAAAAQPAANAQLRRAMAAVLQRMAQQYGLAAPAPAAVLDDSEHAEASFAFSEGDAASRATTPRPRPKPLSIVTAAPPPPPAQADDAEGSSSNAAASTAAPSGFAQKVAGLSSFLQDVFAEIDEEGGTPRESRTPAHSQLLHLDTEQRPSSPSPSAAASGAATGMPRESFSPEPGSASSSSRAKPRPAAMMLTSMSVSLSSSSMEGAQGQGLGDLGHSLAATEAPTPCSAVASASTSPPMVSPATLGPMGGGGQQQKAAWGTLREKKGGGASVLPSLSSAEEASPSAAAVSVPVGKGSGGASRSPAPSTKAPKRSRKATSAVLNVLSLHKAEPLTSPQSAGSNANSGSGPAGHNNAFKSFRTTLGPVVIGADTPTGSSVSGGGGLRSSRGSKKGSSDGGSGSGNGGPTSGGGSNSGAKDASSSLGAPSSSSSSSAPGSAPSSALPSPSAGSSILSGVGGATTTGTGKVKKKLKKKGAGKGGGKKSSQQRIPPSGMHLQKALPSAPIRCMVVVGGSGGKGQEVWTSEKDGAIVVRDALSGEVLKDGRLVLPGAIVTAMAYESLSGCVWVGTEAGKLLRIDPASRSTVAQSDCFGNGGGGGGGGVGGATTCGASATSGGGGMGSRTFTSSIHIILCVRDRVFTGSADFMIRCWSASSAAYLRTFSGHSLAVRTLMPMGSQLLWSGSDDRTIRIHNVDSGECVQVLAGHGGGVTSLVTVGAMVCSAGADDTIRVWKLTGGAGGVGGGGAHAADTQHHSSALVGGGYDGAHALATSPPSARGHLSWECVQEVACGVGRISALLVVSKNMLWSVGQHEKVVVWNVASGAGGGAGGGGASARAGGAIITKKTELEGGHSNFITGLQMVRRTEVKTVWTHSLSTATATTADLSASNSAGGGGGDRLCMWTYVVHNGKDVSEQLQQLRNQYHGLIFHLQGMKLREEALRQTLTMERRSFQAELQRLVLLLAEAQARALEQSEVLSSQAGRITSTAASLATLRAEHSALVESHAALESRLAESLDLHEEYAQNLKKVIADNIKRREQAENTLRAVSADAERSEQRADEEASARRAHEARAVEAERRAADLDSALAAMRLENEQLKLQAAHSQLASQAEETLLADLASARRAAQEAEAARAAECRRAESLVVENARLSESAAAHAAQDARMAAMGRDLFEVSSALDRSRKLAAESLARPLKLLSRENAAKSQSELTAAAGTLANDLAKSHRRVRELMHTYLTGDQLRHVGAVPSANTATGASPPRAGAAQPNSDDESRDE